MSSITDNTAAWITAPTKKPFEVGPGPEPDPEPNEVVIRVAVTAINPSEWKASVFLAFTSIPMLKRCPDARLCVSATPLPTCPWQ